MGFHILKDSIPITQARTLLHYNVLMVKTTRLGLLGNAVAKKQKY